MQHGLKSCQASCDINRKVSWAGHQLKLSDTRHGLASAMRRTVFTSFLETFGFLAAAQRRRLVCVSGGTFCWLPMANTHTHIYIVVTLFSTGGPKGQLNATISLFLCSCLSLQKKSSSRLSICLSPNPPTPIKRIERN